MKSSSYPVLLQTGTPYSELPGPIKVGHRRNNSAYQKTERGKLTLRRAKLKHKYGISLEDYDLLLKSQNGRCAICHRTSGKRRLVVDHDHKTGRVRGLLCDVHNRSLGNLGDDEDGVIRLLEYLRTPTALEK